MSEVAEKKVVRTNTSSGTNYLIMAGLAASLSGPMSCYGFEEDNNCVPIVQKIHGTSNSVFDTESLDRLKNYTEDFYGDLNSESFEPEILEGDLKFTELAQEFAESQKDVDPEIQIALNKFSKILGSQKPKKDRF